MVLELLFDWLPTCFIQVNGLRDLSLCRIEVLQPWLLLLRLLVLPVFHLGGMRITHGDPFDSRKVPILGFSVQEINIDVFAI